MDSVSIFCAYDEMRPVASLVENPLNPNRHPQHQIELLAKVIKYQGWRSPIVVSTRSGYVIKGHGRLLAARLLGLESVPVDLQDYENEAAEWADMVADNRLSELSELAETELKTILRELDGKIDLDLSGFDGDDLAALLADVPEPSPDDEVEEKSFAFSVKVPCTSEQEAQELCKKLSTNGFQNCKVTKATKK